MNVSSTITSYKSFVKQGCKYLGHYIHLLLVLCSGCQPRWLSGLRRSRVHSLWLLVDHCVLRNWDRILVRAVRGLISRAGMVSICPLLWQRDVKLQQTTTSLQWFNILHMNIIWFNRHYVIISGRHIILVICGLTRWGNSLEAIGQIWILSGIGQIWILSGTKNSQKWDGSVWLLNAHPYI